MKIAFVGGNTCGHIIPLLRLNQYLDLKDSIYLGLSYGIEKMVVKEIEYVEIPPFKIRNYFKTKEILNQHKIDLIISSGGKNAINVLLYAIIHKINYYLIEENAILGYTNLLFKFKAKAIFSPFLNRSKKFKLALNPASYFKVSNFKKEYDLLFVGGSKGSIPISKLSLYFKDSSFKVVLICGKYYDKYKKYQNNHFIVLDYVNDFTSYLEKSRLVISRAGSSTIFEVLRIGIPYIVIPSLKTKRHHQERNALFLKENDLCYLADESINKADLTSLIKLAFLNESRLIKNQKEYIKKLSLEPFKEIL